MRARSIALLALAAAALLPVPAAASTPQPAPTSVQPAELRLVGQTATVAPGEEFEVRVDVGAVPPDGSVRLVLHGRVRSRSELTASIEGIGLRTEMYAVSRPVAELPVAADGSRRLSLSFDPAQPGGIQLSAAGAYPLEVIAQDATGTTVSRLVTHVLAEPPRGDESPPLAVGVLAQLGTPPALQPDGSLVLDRDELDEQLALAQALAEVPAADATLAVVPETIDALAASASDEDLALLDAIEAAAVDRSVLAQPYVRISPQVLASAGLRDQVAQALDRGSVVLRDALGVEPDASTWVAGADLGAEGLAAMEALGFRHAVVDAEQVEPLSPGALRLSLAQPFTLAPPDDPADPSRVDALAVDPRIEARIDEDRDDAQLLAHRLLAELTVLWLEQPAVDRAVVVPIDVDVPAEAVAVVLGGIEESQLFQPAGLEELFELADPLRDAGRTPVERALEPTTEASIGRAHANRVAAGWARVDTLRSLVGVDNPLVGDAVDHLLLATAAELDRDEQRAHLEAVFDAVDEVTDAVSMSPRATITLTAREGTVPITVENASGVPIEAVITVESSRLDFPEGETIPITLAEGVTRRDLDVRARASGAFPLDVEITSPDGEIVLGSTRYTVQSTAVSGAGLVLSIGAGLFLVVWWARHWREARRSAKLVAGHPARHAKSDN